MINWLCSLVKKLVMTPVYMFWSYYKYYKKHNNYPAIIGIFILALAGLSSTLVLSGFALYYSVAFLISNPEWVLIGSAIYLLFSYGRSSSEKMQVEQKKQQLLTEQLSQSALEDNASKGYEAILTELFQVIREISAEYEVREPSIFSDIEMPIRKWEIMDGITYYYFKAVKKNTVLMSEDELLGLKNRLSFTLAHKLQSDVSKIKAECYKDSDGNFFDPIVVDSIKDMGNFLLILVVPTNASYAKKVMERRQKELRFSSSSNTSTLSTTWDEDS